MGRPDGIDVSSYQGVIDWNAVKASGKQWLAARATVGGRTDTFLGANRAGMQGVRTRLFYDFLYPGHDASAFIRSLGVLQPGEGAMLDAEASGISVGDCLRWLGQVEAWSGRPAAVYTGAYVAGGTIWRSGAIFNGQRPRILAAYTDQPNAARIAAPYGWDAWQYTSTQACPGVRTLVDHDQVDQWARFDAVCQPSAPPPNFPPYDPWHHKFGLWPVAPKEQLTLGTGYAPGTQRLQPMVEYFHHVCAFEAGQQPGLPYTVFTEPSKLCVRNLNAFFNRDGANRDQAIEAWAGVCGPQTWAVIDFLASRPR